MDLLGFNSTQQLRAKVLGGMCLVLGSLSLCMALANALYSQSYVFALSEVIYSLASFYLYKKSKTCSYALWQKYLYILFLVSLVIVGTYLKPLKHGLLVWAFTLPIIYYLLLGKKIGFYVTLATLFTQVTVIYLSNLTSEGYFLFVPLLINYIFCYACIWTVSHVYESNRMRSEEKLHKLALEDSLTKVNNRLAFRSAFEPLVDQRATPLYLLIIDVDHFKQVNDQYGHETGDDVLIGLAKKLVEQAEYNNVYRLGGEEFCIFLHQKSKIEAIKQGNAIRQSIEQAIFVSQDKRIPVTVSIGLSEYQPGMTLSGLLKEADDYLYVAKKNGRNRLVHQTNNESSLTLVQ
jgi:diguanylate cyclase (GGDEF)-like protein